jgi:hypothetical protein
MSSRRRGHVARKAKAKGKAVYYPVVELPRERVLDPETSTFRERRRQQWHPWHASKRAAERELTAILGDLDRGTYVRPVDLSLGAFLMDRWLPAMAGSAEPTTLEIWGHYARACVQPRIGHIPSSSSPPTTSGASTPAWPPTAAGQGGALPPRPSRTCTASSTARWRTRSSRGSYPATWPRCGRPARPRSPRSSGACGSRRTCARS